MTTLSDVGRANSKSTIQDEEEALSWVTSTQHEIDKILSQLANDMEEEVLSW